MPSRTARRRLHKRLARLKETPASEYSRVASTWTKSWRIEVRRRAQDLGAPAAWALLEEPQVVEVVKLLDPEGKLGVLEDLQRIVVEAIAEVSDKHLGRLSKPVGVRIRRK